MVSCTPDITPSVQNRAYQFKIGGNAMLTQQVQPCLAIGRRLDYVLSTENVEERPADANVLIRGWAESDRFAFKCYGGASELTSVSNFGSRPWQRQPPRLTSSIFQNPLEKWQFNRLKVSNLTIPFWERFGFAESPKTRCYSSVSVDIATRRKAR